ncbi:MAG: S8 family serine peptidase [Bacteroidales bacterium]|nr:S8 family serine peptidase [Bacteroidales bacterium]
MKKFKLLFVMVLVSVGVQAQEIATGVYWIYFSDKEGDGYQIDQPAQFLSDRSVNRRAMQGLAVDRADLPVSPDYLQEIREMGVEIRHVSRWLNGIAMINMDDTTFQQVVQKPFTDTVPWIPATDDLFFPHKSGESRFDPPLESSPAFDYGVAREQVEMVRTDQLHKLGYTGRGVWIGVLDAGFFNVDSLPSFIPLIDEGRILETRNYVNETPLFRQSSSHGMYVLSIMAGEWDGNMVGTAPHASYLLCMTEDPDRETRIEEIAWIEAAEYADSLGADLINTSLGYSDFDEEEFDYTYRDMDGKTTYISRAASLTASRGMILCNSAGNSGDDEWFYITAPADATDILAVGAVDSTNLIANFSSRGPTFDARIKPDVTAMGQATGIQSKNGGLARGSGTSFSSPVIAGSVATLWQAFPELPAREMIHMVRQNGDRYKNPDSTYGFGTPNMLRSYHAITRVPAGFAPGEMEIWPNPASERIMIRIPETESGKQQVRFYDLSGKMTCSMQIELPGEMALPGTMNSGIYIIEIRTTSHIYRSRLIKQ